MKSYLFLLNTFILCLIISCNSGVERPTEMDHINDFIVNGNLEEANRYLYEKARTDFDNYYKSLLDVHNNIKSALSDDKAKEELAKLNDSSINLLANDKYLYYYLEDPILNDSLLARMKSHLDNIEAIRVSHDPKKIAAQIEEFNQNLENKQLIKKSFATNGMHFTLGTYTKNSMHNPKSFQHVKTTYVDSGEDLVVTMQFRGTNKLGATVLNRVSAVCAYNGDILEIIGSE